MSSAVPTKKSFPPNYCPPGRRILMWIRPLLTTTVGMKVTTAITGTMLTLFVLGHLAGNLKIFAGPDDINAYAQFLKDQGPLLWVARGGLLAAVLLHVVMVVRLKMRSQAARPVPYSFSAVIQASVPSRMMIWTGLMVAAFILLHLAHYTLGWIGTVKARHEITGQITEVSYLELKDHLGRHDVYAMMIAGFKSPLICVIYVFAQFALCMHLMHGIPSMFQTLGLNTPRTEKAFKQLGMAVAVLVAIGNLAIVAAVQFKLLPDYGTATRFVGG